MNAQHTAESTVGAQALQAIRWETPVDLNPQYSGSDLLIHYGSPLITGSNTVIVPVKTGATNGFEVEALNGTTGNVLWTQTTDYILPSHNWTPSYSPVLTAQNRLYFAGAGGTIYYLDSPDTAGSHTVTQIAFYGLSNYTANPSAYNGSVFIDTPITADSQGDIFFGFRTEGTAPGGLVSGIARIDANGNGIWMSALAISGGDTNITRVPHQAAPALSNDEGTLYVSVGSGTNGYGYLVALNANDLSVKLSNGVAERVRLKDPRNNNANDAQLLDDSSASPMVGPDGDVYYGVFGNPYNGSRGWMLHFSSDLLTEKIPGAFGWDDTASIVPASMVPSYTGTSAYLICTKYNNYSDNIPDNGDGMNKVAILDPNATEVEPHASSNGLLVMKEVLTVLGPTKNPNLPGVDEWCINSAVVDPITKSVLVNSEDGNLYRWDLTTNTLTQSVKITNGIGEAYTPTIMGPDGAVYAINNATLFAVDAADHFSISAPSSATAGSPFSITVTALDVNNKTALGYLGTIHFTSSALKASLPANYTFTSGDAGVHTFSVTLRSAGTQSITATDTTTSSITGTQTSLTVNPGPTHHLVLSYFPSPTVAGVIAQNFRVTAQDLYGNRETGFTDTVAFTSSDGQAVLPANYTFTNTDAGVHAFSATLKTAGTQFVTVKDTTTTSVWSGTRSGITVTPAAASQLQISGFPASVTAGTGYGLTVSAIDPFGNIATGYRGTVTFASSDGAAALPRNYTYVSGDAGTHSFTATLNTAGTQSITVTDTGNSSITGTDSGITVVSVQPTAAISGPSSGVPGQPLTYTLTASESGLPANTAYSYSIQWSDGSPVQTLSGTSGTQVNHAFTTPGTYTVSLTATDPNNNASIPVTMSVTVSTVLMETDPYISSQTALYVGGTTGNDTIAITPVSGGGVQVGMNFVNYGTFSPTGHVVVYGQSGNDIIKTAAQNIGGVLTYVNVPLLVFAGNGNDILNATGSLAGNVLVGGSGSDRLLGGKGGDILIGGPGPSTLNAGSGGDILIGGTTNYDTNAAALASVLAEWNSSDDYATRIARITGSMSGGLNTVFLNSSTVHADGQVNNLYNGAGMDWYFAGVMDVIFNKQSGEVVTSIT